MRRFLLLACLIGIFWVSARPVNAKIKDAELRKKMQDSVTRALNFLARDQKQQGFWEAQGGQYRVAMTALAGNALLCEGSTTTRGKYSKNIRNAVSYLLEMSHPNGLIGYENDYHYMYGHGFSMLFLSQVFGEEEDAERREDLRIKLTKAVEFCGAAQTTAGGWGYVSAKDGQDFDEGSTCITQVQGLRACRNAGIPVPKEVVDRAVAYIKKCTTTEGGVQYSIKGGGARPPITAAAVACLFNSGDYDSEYVKKLLNYCRQNLSATGDTGRSFGHWHYAHYYYAQALYRIGGDEWDKYYTQIVKGLVEKQIRQEGNKTDGSWGGDHVGAVYVTAINATILQLENGFLPIYQR
ncbi:MAG: hypothetical protein JWM11_5558 [Planctomycetaceae bacterium]|nr:hypothetical protein [Planctomycetaceae bacterium]